ncbi:MAG: sigma-54 dependent transcriptional regulator [Thermodesulfobacteriota bacterium]
MAKILIIDDDPVICTIMQTKMVQMGHNGVIVAHTLAVGLSEAEEHAVDLIFLDVYLPDGNGLNLLPSLTNLPSRPEVIIFTARGSSNGAEIAIQNGAWDYLQKPVRAQELALSLKRVLLYRQSRKEAQEAVPALKRHGIIGSSAAIEKCRAELAMATQGEAQVLITGETGTGKELFSRAIHANSRRAQKNFVVVDCAALPENLIESALFGHERGAFTGAERSKPGLIKEADGGTLFLDEIGELPLRLQKSFLRVLQEHRFRPVGSDTEVESNFRLVAATHRDLAAMVKKKEFREDLLYRLQAIVIELPPLRERAQDINELAHHFVEKICTKYGLASKEIGADTLEVLSTYPWPGNIRELINTLESAVNVALNEPLLFPKHLPIALRVSVKQKNLRPVLASETNLSPAASPEVADPRDKLTDYRQYRETVMASAERRYLEALMTRTGASIKAACQISGLGRTRLYNLLNKHGIKRNKN